MSEWRGRYPKGAVEKAISALETTRPDTREGSADLLYRAREHNGDA